ncbi:MAG: ribose-phosphate pyrophosphokinase [Candidatus Alcyoniella australis]|nr:ribose-phosphate pyrophosphokinase [Candidatus Alcyoniella australis]
MELQVFTGTANRPLAKSICEHLGIKLGKAMVRPFPDSETEVVIDESVRGNDTFVIQSTCRPANKTLMELLIMIDALKRASASRITAVIPYFGYARQDRKVASRAPITAKLVADLITAAGANRVLTCDLHAGQIQGFFNLPVDNLYASTVFLNMIGERINEPIVAVSPDAGGVKRARYVAQRFSHGGDLAIIDKRRDGPGSSEVMNIVGQVKGRICILIDDIADSAGTLCTAAQALKREGAKEIYAFATHPVLSGKAAARIKASPMQKLYATDTIPLLRESKQLKKIDVLSVAGLFAKAIDHIHNGESVSILFEGVEAIN